MEGDVAAGRGSADVDFRSASERVLSYLRAYHPMGFWAVTRTENGRQTYLALGDNEYGLHRTGSHAWDDSLCVQMVAGRGPHIAPDVARVPAFANAAIREKIEIGAYAGTPIRDADGSLFGAICGISSQAHDGPGVEVQPLLDLLGELLGEVVAGERARAEADRLLLSVRAGGDVDPVTGLRTRRSWERAVTEEELRYSRLADPTCVVFVQGEATPGSWLAPEDVLTRTARAVREASRLGDVAARLEHGFGLLLVDTPESVAEQRVEALVSRLADLGIAASVGLAAWTPSEGASAATLEASRLMRADSARQSGLAAPGA